MKNWPTRRLGEYVEERTDRLRGSPATIYSVTNENGFVRSLDLFDKQVFSADTGNYKRVNFRDLAYNPSRINVGSVAMCENKDGGAVSPMYVIVRTKPGLLPHYLLHFLKSDAGLEHIRQRCEGAVRFQLKFRDLSAIPIFIPPLAEQDRILRLLDDADQLRKVRKQADRRASQLIPALFHKMFGDPRLNTRHLPIARLGEIASVERGKFSPRPRNDPSYYDGEYPFIQTGDITESAGYLTRWKQTLNDRGRSVSKEFPAGTIVIAIVGATIGQTAILGHPVYAPDSVVGIQPYPERALKEYLIAVLQHWRPVFIAQAPETARANLNAATLKAVEIPLPPLPLQNEFAQRVSEIHELEVQQAASRRRWKRVSIHAPPGLSSVGEYVIVHELLYFGSPNHGKLWKTRMRARLGEYEILEQRLRLATKYT